MSSVTTMNKDDFPIFSAICCTYNLIDLSWPRCIGCSLDYQCLCFGNRFCFEPFDEEALKTPLLCTPQEGDACQLGCYVCSLYCKTPTTCTMVQSHFLCCVNNLVFPNDKTMPCMVALLFIMCYPTVAVVPKFGDYKNSGVCGYCVPDQDVPAPNTQ